MAKKIFVILAMGLFLVTAGKLCFAQEANEKTISREAVNVGNKVCPVSGEKIDEKTKATYEYEGKVYNFCCPMCVDSFKSNPEEYIKKVEGELATSEKEPAQDSQAHEHMQEGHHR